jgi:hypothetical protein
VWPTLRSSKGGIADCTRHFIEFYSSAKSKYNFGMTRYAIATSEICKDLLSHCGSCYRATVKDTSRLQQLSVLGESISDLERFVRGYEKIEDPSVDTDDEILNWAFSEAASELRSAIWLLASGFCKASASSARNAFDIAVASLYFQIRENTDAAAGGSNRYFSEWDAGRRQTPNWGEMRPFIGAQTTVTRFNANCGLEIVDEDCFRNRSGRLLSAIDDLRRPLALADELKTGDRRNVLQLFDEGRLVSGQEANDGAQYCG